MPTYYVYRQFLRALEKFLRQFEIDPFFAKVLSHEMVEALDCETCIVALIGMFIIEDTPRTRIFEQLPRGSCLRKDLSTPLDEKLSLWVEAE